MNKAKYSYWTLLFNYLDAILLNFKNLRNLNQYAAKLFIELWINYSLKLAFN